MLAKNLLSFNITAAVLLSAFVPTAYAIEAPVFPACANPGASVKVSYNEGTHGVPGSSTSYSGRDTVYSLDNGNYLQCLCPTNGAGVQTNWWKVSELSQDDLSRLTAQGWIYIADGSAWGLDSAAYLANNSNFSCNPGTGGGPGDGLSDGRSDGRSDGMSDGKSSNPGVLGLANTGNTLFIAAVLVLGFVLLASGIILGEKKKK